MSEPLKRHWITQATNVPPAMLLRQDFDLPRPVRSASLCISGLGYFVAWINGRRVGDHVLDPAQSDYEVRTFCVTHDVTALVAQGRNTIGAELGDGLPRCREATGEEKQNGLPVRHGMSFVALHYIGNLRVCVDYEEIIP